MDSAYDSTGNTPTPSSSSQSERPSGSSNSDLTFPELLASFNSLSCSSNEELDAGELLLLGAKYPITQINGCRRCGPPLEWFGPEPAGHSEIFVSNLPRNTTEHQFLPLFARFGRIYDCRMMMEFTTETRGFAYIRFEKEEQAFCAVEVMKHFLVSNKKTLVVETSYQKSRLFAKFIPKDVPFEEINEAFRTIFPKVKNIFLTSQQKDEKKYQFCFLDFQNHEDAVEAKKSVSPGIISLWGVEVKIVWAVPEEPPKKKNDEEIKTLFIRNIPPKATSPELKSFLRQGVSSPEELGRITQIRDFAFVEFQSREVAASALERLQEKKIQNHSINIQWARPPPSSSLHQFKNHNFNTDLRLKCMANSWNVPIFIYGRKFETVQVVGVIINRKKFTNVYIVEVHFEELTNIHSRVSEAIVSLINAHGHLPVQHLVLRLSGDMLETLGYMFFKDVPLFLPSILVDKNASIYFDEIYDVALYAQTIAKMDAEALFSQYEHLLAKAALYESLILDLPKEMGRCLGCVAPTTNFSPPLPHGLDNRQMIFALCDAATQTNFKFSGKPDYPREIGMFHVNGTVEKEIYLQPMTLFPLKFVQAQGDKLQVVLFGRASPDLSPLLPLMKGF